MKSTLLTPLVIISAVSVAGARGFVTAPGTAVAGGQDSVPDVAAFAARTARPFTGPGMAVQKSLKTSPMYVTAEGKQLYGGLVYADSWSSSHAPYGIYSSTLTAPLTVSQCYVGDIFKVNGGGFYADGMYYFIDYTISSFDGEEVVYTYLYTNEAYPFRYVGNSSLGMDHIAKDLTWDPLELRAYGIFSIGSLEDKYLVGAMDMDTYKIEEFCRLPQTHVAIASDRRGNIFTVGGDGILYRLDKEARDMIAVGPTGVPAVDVRYAQSATFDFSTDIMYWAALHADGTSALYTVDTATGHATKVGDFPDNEEFAGIYFPDIVAGAAPEAAEELYPTFEDGSLTGTVAFDAPKVTNDGADMTGELTYTLRTNGEITHTGTVKTGKRNYEIEMTMPDNGFYTFTLTLGNAAGESLPTSLRTYIGNDSPVACPEATAVNEDRLGKVELKWTKPRKGSHGGYIDIDGMTFDLVRFPDNVAVATGTSDTTFVDMIERTDLECYYYAITPCSKGLKGLVANTNKVVVGHVAEMPYTQNFDTDVDFSTYSVDDVHGDSSKGLGTWDFSGYKGGVATATPAYGDNSGNPKDDWLFTPPLHLRNDRTYTLTYKAMSQGNRIVPSFREYMEVKMGKAPSVDAMTETLLENCEIDNEYTFYNTYEHVLHVTEEGNYHIGFHATTPGDDLMWNLVLDDVVIAEGAFLEGPARVENLTVTPGEKGALTATVSFKAPMKAIDGTDLESLSRIEIMRDDVLVKIFPNPVLGESLSYTDTDAKQGFNEYLVVAYEGENRGLDLKSKVYVGFDKPCEPTGIVVRDVDGVPEITWNAPSETGPDGHYVDPAACTYTVVRYFSEYSNEVVATDIKATTFTDVEATAPIQTQVVYRITAKNSIGESAYATSPVMMIGGENSVLPLHESFPDRYSTCEALRYITNEYGSAWGTSDALTDIGVSPIDDDGGMALFGLNGSATPTENGISGMLYSNRIQLTGCINPMVNFYLCRYAESRNTLTVCVNPETGGWRDIITVPVAPDEQNSGWVQVSVPLSDFVDARYIQLGFKGTAYDDELVIIDNIVIDDMLDHNLELTSMTVPSILVPGQDCAAVVTVCNRGLEEAADYKVMFDLGEMSFEQQGSLLYPGNSRTFTFNLSPDLGFESEMVAKAEIAFEPDMKKADNVSPEQSVFTELPRMAYVTDLVAEETSEGTFLSWGEPDGATALPESSVDDFESYTTFIIDNIGPWKVYDGDEQFTWGISDGTGNGSILKYDNAGKPMAWQVFDPVKAGLSINYDDDNQYAEQGYELPDWRPYSGSQMLISYAPRSGFSDDWLISEELNDGAQIVSFMARSILSTYKERCEVLASYIGREPSDFKCLETFNAGKKWTRMAVALPAGTRYFAIRCTSPQQFALIVDDVTYTPVSASVADAALQGYNLYCDGKIVNTSLIAERKYAVPDSKRHTYRVSAVYDLGESRLSNAVDTGSSGFMDVTAGEVSIMAKDGGIYVDGAGGRTVTIHCPDGRAMFVTANAPAHLHIPLPSGLYIVSAADTTAKVAVK